MCLFVDPGVRQRGPDRGLASAVGQAKAVRAVGEHVHGVGNVAGRERRGETVGVLGWHVRVPCGVPDEERRRLGRDPLPGWSELAASTIPIGDAIIVLRSNGPKATAYGVHGATAGVLLATAAFLFT